MFFRAVPATSLLRAIRRALGVQDPPLVDASRLLPPPKPVTAATWDRYRHVCPVCGQEMTKNLFPIGPNDAAYFCLPCNQAIADEAAEQLQTIRNRTGKLPIGALNQFYRNVAPGTIARQTYHAQQQRALEVAQRNIISALSTNKELHKAPEVSQLATLTPRHHTGPLPARDIEYAPTPRVPDVSQMITIHPNPATPTPETRESLFVDVPDTTTHDEEDADEEATEKRRIVRRVITEEMQARTTIQIPAMEVEIPLLEMMRRAPFHAQSTGENERLPEKQAHWML